MSQVKVAVIADDMRVQKFGRDAVDAIRRCTEITVFSCRNTRFRKQPLRHAAYYALNLITLRNPLTRAVDMRGGSKPVTRVVEFDSIYEGAWQMLPPTIVDELKNSGFDVVLKLGMGLLRVPPDDQLPIPILSYHHGDPDRYRGRPAGFWEIVQRRKVIGQVVQVIGNKLDAGRIVASAETKVYPHSYRRTLIEAYRHSPLIINEAIANALTSLYLPRPCQGRNYRLPGNWTVAEFLLRMAWDKLRRLAYGALVEKRWNVSLAHVSSMGGPEVVSGREFPAPSLWRTLSVGRPYSFYADPFFSTDPPGILVEGLRRSTGRGEILLIDGNTHVPLSRGPGHYSYPATIILQGRQVVLPETASWSPPICYEIKAGVLRPLGPLRLEQEARVLDPTLVEHEERLYLFGNIRAIGSNALFLWSAASANGDFHLHPASPIRISPIGARMAGGLLKCQERLVRFGQDFSSGYGDGIIAFEVEELTEERFRERPIGEVRFGDRRGPHTLNFNGEEIAFDWYFERFSLLAGLRRALARRPFKLQRQR